MRQRLGGMLVLGVLVAAAGCEVPLAPLDTPFRASPTPAPSSSPSPRVAPQATPAATASPDASPSAAPTPTPTPEPTPVVTPTPAPTPTPSPIGGLVVDTSAETSGSWVVSTAMAHPRMGHVVVPIDGRLVVVGGFPDEILEGFSPTAGTWLEQDLTAAFVAQKNVSPGQYFSCGGTVGTNRLVVAGGFDGTFPIDYPRLYTLTEGFEYSVAFGARIPNPRYAVAGTTLGSKLYVAGGVRTRSVNLDGVFHGVQTAGDLEAFDVTAGTWATLADMPTPVSGATAVTLNGLLYVLGGQTSGGAATAAVQAYRPDIDQWVSDPAIGAIPAMRLARHSASAAVLGGRIYVFGGITAGNALTGSAEVYDPATGLWQMLPGMPFPRYLHAAVAYGGRLYVVGGNDAQGQPQRLVEAFLP